MDDVHAEFERLMADSLDCADGALPARLARLRFHLGEHFESEDGWMHGTDFPARDCHIAEHAAVLKSADKVISLAAAGNVAVGRSFATELHLWFPAHAAYLDSALAAWLCRRRYGGTPLVLRRN